MSTEEQDWDELMGITDKRTELVAAFRQLIEWAYTGRPTDTDKFMAPSTDDMDHLALFVVNEFGADAQSKAQEMIDSVARVMVTNTEDALVGEAAMEVRKVLNAMYVDMLIRVISSGGVTVTFFDLDGYPIDINDDWDE